MTDPIDGTAGARDELLRFALEAMAWTETGDDTYRHRLVELAPTTSDLIGEQTFDEFADWLDEQAGDERGLR